MGEVRAIKPGMERHTKGGTVDQFVMASLADFIETNGKRPDGVIVCWMGEDGGMTVGWDQAGRTDLAFASIYLGNISVSDGFGE